MLKSLIYLSGKSMLLPLYHTVSDHDLKHIKNLYSFRNTKQFIQDIDFILKYYEPINVDTLIKSINSGTKIKRNSVLFTFDDGLREVHDIIAPILKQKGIPAVFFVNSDFVDNKNLFYRYKASLLVEEVKSKEICKSRINEISSKLIDKPNSKKDICKSILDVNYKNKFVIDEIAKIINYDFNEFLVTNQPYLTSLQLKNLIKQGFSVGAHSVDHPEYFNIPFDEQIKQTTESIKWIKKTFKQEYNLFAFPFTDFQVSRQFFETIYSSKNPMVDLSFACAGIKDELYPKHLQRLPIEMSNESARQIITKEYIAYLGKCLIGKNLIRRK